MQLLRPLALAVLLRCCEAGLVSVNVSASPADVAVAYGADTGDITCSYRRTAGSLARPTAVTFASVPRSVLLSLQNYYLAAPVRAKSVPFEDNMTLTFSLKNVRQSGRYSCDISSSELKRPGRAFVRVFVRTGDSCEPSRDLLRNRECFDNESVCIPGQYLEKASLNCVTIASPRYCRPVDICRRCACRKVEKLLIELPYRKVAAVGGDLAPPDLVRVEGDLFGTPQTPSTCFSCVTEGRITTYAGVALMVTFLMLLSGAITVVGSAVCCDWCKRRRQLQQIARELTEVNLSAVEMEALRRVGEDRPPSYVDTRKGDLQLTGVPPPSYDDICDNANSEVARDLTSSEVATVRGSVATLAAVHGKKL